jgi:hypothetical protein
MVILANIERQFVPNVKGPAGQFVGIRRDGLIVTGG